MGTIQILPKMKLWVYLFASLISVVGIVHGFSSTKARTRWEMKMKETVGVVNMTDANGSEVTGTLLIKTNGPDLVIIAGKIWNLPVGDLGSIISLDSTGITNVFIEDSIISVNEGNINNILGLSIVIHGTDGDSRISCGVIRKL